MVSRLSPRGETFSFILFMYVFTYLSVLALDRISLFNPDSPGTWYVDQACFNSHRLPANLVALSLERFWDSFLLLFCFFFFLCSSHSIRWRESTDKWRRQYYFPYRTASYSSFPLVCEGSEDILHPASTWETIPSTWWLQGGCCPVAQGGNTAWGRRDQVSLKPTGMSPLEGMKRILTIFKRRKKDPKPQLPRLQLFGKENLDPGNSWSRPKLCGGIQGRDF